MGGRRRWQRGLGLGKGSWISGKESDVVGLGECSTEDGSVRRGITRQVSLELLTAVTSFTHAIPAPAPGPAPKMTAIR